MVTKTMADLATQSQKASFIESLRNEIGLNSALIESLLRVASRLQCENEACVLMIKQVAAELNRPCAGASALQGGPAH